MSTLFIIGACKSQRNITEPDDLENYTTITNTEQLLRSMVPGARLLVKSGDYFLSDWTELNTEYLRWIEVFDGKEPQFTGLNDVVIKGEAGARILIKPRYAWVLHVSNSDNLRFENLTFGHEDGGYCVGGVLGFKESQSIRVKACQLFGSGTEGYGLEGVQNFVMEGGRVYECTYDLMTVSNSSGVRFEGVTFSETGEFDLININQSRDLSFKDCVFRENNTGDYLPHFFRVDPTSSPVLVEGCTFQNNRVSKLVNRTDGLTLKDNTFEGNDFE